MYHKLKKDAGSLKVGDYIDVHKDQLDDLVKRNVIESEGVEELPGTEKPEVGDPKVGSTADILNPDEVKETKKK